MAQPHQIRRQRVMEAADNDDNSSSDASGESCETVPWIPWFCSERGNEFFCNVEEEYIRDNFNLTGLPSMIDKFNQALDIILNDDEELEDLPEEQQQELEDAAAVAYGMIHARYITTAAGLHRMHEKYRNSEFGRCPRVFCRGQAVLPLGLSDQPYQYAVSTFCPRCREVYYPKRLNSVDGAFFGTTFAHLFLMVYPELVPPRDDNSLKYVPRVFGFRIHRESPYYRGRPGSNSQSLARSQSSSNVTTGPSGTATAAAAVGGGIGLPPNMVNNGTVFRAMNPSATSTGHSSVNLGEGEGEGAAPTTSPGKNRAT